MSSYEKRLGPKLTFDNEKEQDLIQNIEILSRSRSLGTFISHLLRLAFESPEEYGNGREIQKLIAKMEQLGTTPTRYNYFSQVSKEVDAMRKKIDDIYEMTYKTYILAQMGKTLGIEKKAENQLMSTFILERQMTEMCECLGVGSLYNSFSSNKLEDTKKKAEKTLEYILESYDSIIGELKQSLNTKSNADEVNEKLLLVLTALGDSTKTIQSVAESKNEYKNAAKNISSNEDEYIELAEKPKETASDDDIVIKPLSGQRALQLQSLFDD